MTFLRGAVVWVVSYVVAVGLVIYLITMDVVDYVRNNK